MSEWQKIETAPKDGSRVKLLIPYSREKFSEPQCTDEGYWQALESWNSDPSMLADFNIPQWGIDAGGCWRFNGDDGGFDIQPTHWQPLGPPEVT